jgi:hypothetical protein
MNNSVRPLTIIVSYNNFASRLLPICCKFNPNDVLFNADIPERFRDLQVSVDISVSNFSEKLIVLMASPIECYIMDIVGQFDGNIGEEGLTRKDLDDIQARALWKSDSDSFQQWWVKNFRAPFGISLVGDSFYIDGFQKFRVSDFEIIFVWLQDNLIRVAEIIGELTGLQVYNGIQSEKRSYEGDPLPGIKLEDMVCFPYSFLTTSLYYTSSELQQQNNPNEKKIRKYCDYSQDYPEESVVNNYSSIQHTFPNYVRKELYFQKFWFVDIPRTSSSSIKVELQKSYGPIFGKKNLLDRSFIAKQILPNHIPAIIMKKLLGSDQWRRLFTFTFIRNPWERMVSMYLYRKDKVKNIPHDLSFTEYIVRLQSERGQGLFSYHGFYYGNSDYLIDENGEFLVSFIGRYENRENDLKIVADTLGISGLGEIRTQVGRDHGFHYSTYFNKETQEIVGNLYKTDIELFGYKF